jgi:hypothetical protein
LRCRRDRLRRLEHWFKTSLDLILDAALATAR